MDRKIVQKCSRKKYPLSLGNEFRYIPEVGLVVVRLLHVDDAGLVVLRGNSRDFFCPKGSPKNGPKSGSRWHLKRLNVKTSKSKHFEAIFWVIINPLSNSIPKSSPKPAQKVVPISAQKMARVYWIANQYPECVALDVDGVVAGGEDVEAADIVLVGLMGVVVVVLAVQMVVLLCSVGPNLTLAWNIMENWSILNMNDTGLQVWSQKKLSLIVYAMFHWLVGFYWSCPTALLRAEISQVDANKSFSLTMQVTL